MTPEEKFNREVWWVLQELKYLEISRIKGEIVEFVIKVRPIPERDAPPVNAQHKALYKVQELGGVKIIQVRTGDYWYGKDYISTLKFLQPKFDELYKEYGEKQQEKLNNQLQASKLYGDITIPPELQQAEQTRLLKEENTLLKTLSEEKTATSVSPHPSNNRLSAADRKKLCILEKVKEEWDLAPTDYKKNGVSVVLDAHTPDERYDKWIKECELEDEQRLIDILSTFQQKGIIVSFRKIPQFI